MAASTIGQFALWFTTGKTTSITPTKNTNSGTGLWGAKFAGSMLGASGPASKVLSGYAHYSSLNAIRRVILMTQPPAPKIVYEAVTDLVTGTFSFPHVPPGNYLVIDCMTDNSLQALVYDWVVVA